MTTAFLTQAIEPPVPSITEAIRTSSARIRPHQLAAIREERAAFRAQSTEAEIAAVHRLLATGTTWEELSHILQITDRQARNRYGSKRQRRGEEL